MIAALCLAVLLRSPFVQISAAEANRLAEPALALSELRSEPGRHLGRELVFRVQFRRVVEDWNSYLSRFEPGRWLALEAWPDEHLLWDPAVFERPFARLFLRRGGGFEPLARRARPYQRFEARARVREVFLGEPWIEIVELVPLEGEVGEGTILHVSRARSLVVEGKLDLALEQYERARAGPLPPHALARLLTEIRAAEEKKKRAPPAEEQAVQRE